MILYVIVVIIRLILEYIYYLRMIYRGKVKLTTIELILD